MLRPIPSLIKFPSNKLAFVQYSPFSLFTNYKCDGQYDCDELQKIFHTMGDGHSMNSLGMEGLMRNRKEDGRRMGEW